MRARQFGLPAAALSLLAVAPAVAAGKRTALRVNGVVNINEATPAQIHQLPGVSPKAAQGIVAYREKQKFGRIEELVKVKGFGRKRFEKLRPHLAVTGATTLEKVKSAKAGNAHAPPRGPPKAASPPSPSK